MDRRGFLKGLFGGAAAAAAAALIPTVLDPERQLYVPGAKSFFFPDGKIAIRNVEVASLAETAEITGQHMLRVTFRAPLIPAAAHKMSCPTGSTTVYEHVVEQVSLVSEEAFTKVARAMFADVKGHIDVHFDNGTIAYAVPATMALAEIRAVADAAKAANDVKVGHQQQRQRNFGLTWLEKPIETLVTKDSQPLIRLTD